MTIRYSKYAKIIFLLILAIQVGCSSIVSQELDVDSTDTPTWKSPVAEHCFLEDFDSETFPWPVHKCYNYEEVFKNYEYFETKLDSPNRLLNVYRYKQGQIVETKIFSISKNNKLTLK